MNICKPPDKTYEYGTWKVQMGNRTFVLFFALRYILLERYLL